MLSFNIALLFFCILPYFNLARNVPVETKPNSPGSYYLDDKASIYIADDVQLQANVYGAVDPADFSHSPCYNGIVKHFNSAWTNTPHSTTPHEAAGSLTAVNCPNMCICDIDGVCYKPTSSDVVATLWPYCYDDRCGTYVLITANSDTAGFVSTNGSKTFTAGAQVTPNYGFKRATDSSYINAATVSCKKCMDLSCWTR